MKIKVSRRLPNTALRGRPVLQSTPATPLPPPTLFPELDNVTPISKTRSNSTFTKGTPTPAHVPTSFSLSRSQSQSPEPQHSVEVEASNLNQSYASVSTQTLTEYETALDTPHREEASSDSGMSPAIFGEDNAFPQILEALELRAPTPDHLMNSKPKGQRNESSGEGEGDDPVETKNVRRKRRRSHRKILFTLPQSTKKRPGTFLKRYANQLENIMKEVKKATRRSNRASISEKIFRMEELEGHLSLMHDNVRALKVKPTQDIEYLLLQEELLRKIEDAIEKLREEITVEERNLRR